MTTVAASSPPTTTRGLPPQRDDDLNHQEENGGLPRPVLGRPSSFPPRKRLFESSPPPSPIPREKSPFHHRRPPFSRFFEEAAAQAEQAQRSHARGASWNSDDPPTKRPRLLGASPPFSRPSPPRRRLQLEGKGDAALEQHGSALLEGNVNKPEFFGEDSDAATPGSSAPPTALAALEENDQGRNQESPAPPAISVTPATPRDEEPPLPSQLTPPSSPQPASRLMAHTITTPLRLPPCNVNPFSPERALRNVAFSPAPSPARIARDFQILPPSELASTAPTNQVSRYLEEFEEVEKVGSGSFSDVFKARNRVDGWLYAVKQAKRTFTSPADTQNTLKEVYALAALGSHPHVVRYYSAWVELDRLYIQTEYCSGGSLADQLQKGVRFTEAQLLGILRQVAQGLSHIHKKHLAHLDVKPENIYVDLNEDGDTPLYKIGDLGLISLADATDFSEGDSRYIPRDLFSSDVDTRKLTKADIFSLGCSVYELALGRTLPSRGDEWNSIREGAIQLPSGFTKEFEGILRWMMEADADKRPTAEQLLMSPTLCPEGMKWEVEHKKRLELEKRVHTLQAELEWRRSAMDSAGFRACASLAPLVSKLEACVRCLAPASPLPCYNSSSP